MKNLINWKLFFIVLIACVIASMLVISYSLAPASDSAIPMLITAVTDVQNPIMVSLILILITVVQNIILLSPAVFFGLVLANRVGMGILVLQNILEGKNQTKELKSIIELFKN
jgi:hypothetical protein